jgi:hypothetical protein
VAGGWRELHNFCALTSAIKLTESGTLILARYVAHMQLRERERDRETETEKYTKMLDGELL